MKSEGLTHTTAAWVCTVLLTATIFAVGSSGITGYNKNVEAVRAGHARWVVNELGQTSFEWLPRCSQVQPTKESERK